MLFDDDDDDDCFVDGLGKNYNAPTDEPDFDFGYYFCDNLVETRSTLDDNDFRRFAGLKSNGERVEFILKLETPYELSIKVNNNEDEDEDDEPFEPKDSLKAKLFKKSGNKAFSFGHYPIAVDDYNTAILIAPKDELSILLANRSAAFYHLERYDLALRDCDEALKIGYPDELLYKLEERRARCLLALKCNNCAMESFKNAIKALDTAKLTMEKKMKLEADMRVMLSVMIKGEELIKGKNDDRRDDRVDRTKLMEIERNRLKEKDPTEKLLKERNPLYPACSRSVDIIDSNDVAGRYAIATKDIKPGDVVAVEKPHCLALLAEKRTTHCHNCTIRLMAPYPADCDKCSSVAYCGPRCRDDDRQVHAIECDILGMLWYSNASITCLMALRAIYQRTCDDFLKSRRADSDESRKRDVKPYTSDDYATFRNLVTHENERTTEDLFHRAYMAGWLLRVLKTSTYLPDDVKTPDAPDEKLSDAELVLADAILHHIQILQFNSHEISEFVKPKKRPRLINGKNEFVAGGVYPTVALFNHSCNPCVVRYFIGNTMIVRAVRTITAGTEISENYGPIFTVEEENARKRKLRLQYWFDCGCVACNEHWPLLGDIKTNLLRFKCDTGKSCGNTLPVKIDTETFMIPCNKCGKSTNILKGLKAMQDTDSIYKIAKRHVIDNKHEEALKSYLEILRILDETLALPLKDYHICQQDIRLCMLALGNSAKA